MARMLYDSPAENMNKARIKILVDSSYEPNISSYFTDNNLKPFHDVEMGGQCISMVPISEIVDMVTSGVEFSLYKLEDLTFIVDSLDAYIKYILHNDVQVSIDRMDKDSADFLTNCKETLDLMKIQLSKNAYKKIKGKRARTLHDIID